MTSHKTILQTTYWVGLLVASLLLTAMLVPQAAAAQVIPQKQGNTALANPLPQKSTSTQTENKATVPLSGAAALVGRNPSCLILDPTKNNSINVDTIICAGDYNVSSSVVGSFITIDSDNISLTCEPGTRLNGWFDYDSPSTPELYGIDINYHSYVTISGCELNKFSIGIFSRGTDAGHLATNNVIADNTFTQYTGIPIDLYYTVNSQIYGNTKPIGGDDRSHGEPLMWIARSSNNNIHNNSFYTRTGIRLMADSNGNEIAYNNFGYISGLISNSISLNIEGGANNSIHDNNFTQCPYNAILLNIGYWDAAYRRPNNNIIYQNQMTDVYRGLVLTDGAYDNNISDNTIKNSADAAILFYSYGGSAGPATPIINNTFENNKIYSGCLNGFQFNANASQNNTIHTNLIQSCTGTGVNVETGNTGNSFYANSFVGNAAQVLCVAAGNFFDKNGQGNNWSNYDEEIEECLDNDQNGICDNPYFIAGTIGGYDHFPLTSMTVWGDNAPPVLSPVSDQTANEGHAFSLQLVGSDPDSPFTYYTDAAAVLGSGFTFDANTGLFQWTPGWYQTGVFRINFGVTDGEYRDSDLVTITVVSYYICGDANRDRRVNLLDVSYIINYLYRHGLPPDPSLEVADANYDGRVNLLDVSYIINYLYRHGLPPPEHPGFCHNPTALETEFAN